MMYADLDFDTNNNINSNHNNNKKPLVTVDKFEEKRYSIVVLRCPDRPKLLFDTVCTLTEMQYVVFHGTVIAEGPEAYQEYYVRHVDGCLINSEAERERLVNCLEAVIRRRTAKMMGEETDDGCNDDEDKKATSVMLKIQRLSDLPDISILCLL